jgi:hypothetical protein
VVFFAYAAYGFNMIGMVVRNQDGLYVFEAKPFVFQYFFDGADADPDVDQYSVFGRTQIITVPAASAGQTKEG